MNVDFWRGKRVFISGHTGFKAGWLSMWLQSIGAEVCGYALAPSTDPNLFTVTSAGNGIVSVIGDLSDRAKLADTLRGFSPEIVFHMAAQALVLPSYENPVETFSTNVMGTVHLLDALRDLDTAKVVVNITSDKCYRNIESTRGYVEDDPMGGHDPYSASKGCAELVTDAYRSSFFGGDPGLKLASVRAGNVIGGGDWSAYRLIPDIVRAFSKGEEARIRHPKAVRAWQHVLDPLRGYLMLAERLWSAVGSEYARGWNFGPRVNELHDVETVTRLIASRWGRGAGFLIENTGGPHEAKLLLLDSSLAFERLGWKPLLSFDESIDWTTDWYRAFYDRVGDIRAVTFTQIEKFAAISSRTKAPQDAFS